MHLKTIHEILHQYWGYDKFRPLQEDIVQSVIDKKDTLALLPTGGGKSVCFQVPALYLEGVCLVITPLVALMKDQVEQLKKREINAVAIYSGLHRREIDIILDNCIYGNVKFLYLSPERLKTELFKERLGRMKVGLVAIDESHCISQWGYDFRPPYLEIHELRKALPDTPFVALTATATKKVRADIVEKAGLINPNIFCGSFARENLSYSCFHEEDKERKMMEIITKVKGTGIVYVRTRKKTKTISEYLKKKGISAEAYHAGLGFNERSKIQENWIRNRTRVIVATNAFGMGIDKPDVRFVIHYGIPENLEAYYQEAGRGGRDGKKSYAVLLYNPSDIEELEEKLEISYPDISFLKKVYQALANFYKLATGSGEMSSFDFDQQKFIETYNLPPAPVYYALKRLESENLIQFNEGYFNPSKVFLQVDNKDLYQYQVRNEKFALFIKALLRLYGGELFTDFVTVNEFQIARAAEKSKEEVIKTLSFLEKEGLLIYQKQNQGPQITFLTSRHPAEDLPINTKNLNMLKERDHVRMQAMLSYVTHKDRCRTAILLDYFDEVAEKDCGICDVCVAKRKSGETEDLREFYKEKIIDVLRKSSTTTQDLINTIAPAEKEIFVEVLREMLDLEEIKENNNILSLK